jgi:5-methylcytosine-specific restriction endonuclease McrA
MSHVPPSPIGRILPRRAAAVVEQALADTRVVLVNGARQCGKSTLAAEIADARGGQWRSLDRAATRQAASFDPTEFVANDDLMVIDEIQRVPELLLAIKESVDNDPRPGRFLLTGSARVLSMRAVPDALPGRMETVELWPLSQGEIDDKPDRFVDAAFALGPELRHDSAETRLGYIDRVVRGGFPVALARAGARRPLRLGVLGPALLRGMANVEVPGCSRHRPRAGPRRPRPGKPAGQPGSRPDGHPAYPARCHLDDGPAISPAAAQALACRATMSWMLHDHDGTLLDAGRRHRRATPALRRAVRERDNSRCQFPGCHSRRTDIHHIIPWASGGTTRLSGLILLCEAHHVIVHALGYLITPAPGGAFAFTRPDGQSMPASPALPETDGDLTRCHDADITTDTIIPAGLGDKLDLDLAIWACFANARLDQEASQQQEHLAA